MGHTPLRNEGNVGSHGTVGDVFDFFMFTPKLAGNGSNFDVHMFQMG